MTINKLALTGLASVAIVAATAAPALACDNNHKPAQKPAVHKTVVNHKDNDDHKKDCDHKVVVKKTNCDHKPVVQPKPVEHKDCDHKPVVQPKPVQHKDCNHKPGKGSVTPSPTPAPQQPAVLSSTTQPAPTTLPQTGASDLDMLLILPAAAGAGAAYLRFKLRK